MSMEHFPSTDDQRTSNNDPNVMRHNYRVLTEAEKLQMQQIKDMGLAMHEFLMGIGMSRELSLARTRLEEAVMWSVKHITR